MASPRLTFWCELEAQPLTALLQEPQVLQNLQALGAGVSLALLDLSEERAAVVKRLTAAGVPVTAWLLAPYEEGYFFNLGNPSQAAAFYRRFQAWTARHSLQWAGVGLDCEPDVRELREVVRQPLPVLRAWLTHAVDSGRLRRGLALYRDLLAQMRADGYRVESYQFGVIVDERRAGSTLLQRTLGLLDLPVDREVLMLYSSFLRGPGTLWSYGVEAGAIGVGSTGGGLDAALMPILGWDELARDLRLAHCWTDDIYIYSLEGCVQQDLLARLPDFDWNAPVAAPYAQAGQINALRAGLRGALWASAHPAVLLVLPALLALWRLARRR